MTCTTGDIDIPITLHHDCVAEVKIGIAEKGSGLKMVALSLAQEYFAVVAHAHHFVVLAR